MLSKRLGASSFSELFLTLFFCLLQIVCRVGNPHRQPTVEPTGPVELVAENPLFSYVPEFEQGEIETWFNGNVRRKQRGDFNCLFSYSHGCCE
jgi:hypothetical protein